MLRKGMDRLRLTRRDDRGDAAEPFSLALIEAEAPRGRDHRRIRGGGAFAPRKGQELPHRLGSRRRDGFRPSASERPDPCCD